MSNYSQDSYRPEIDGLRALAVMAVVIYHMDLRWLPGGFLGVDIFFVISGYLIFGILLKQFKNEEFSFPAFWKRRIKRLLPALLVVILLNSFTGILILPNPERNDLLMQTVFALFSCSNMYLWAKTGGYWATASDNITLLHTWSLSVEEQFYLVAPILLWVVNRKGKKFIGASMVLLFLLSLVICLGLTFIEFGDRPDKVHSAAFYFLPSRMWELLFGGVLAFYSLKHPWLPKEGVCGWIHASSFTLIFGSFFFVEYRQSFPGLWPAIPCMGTVLILWSGSERSLWIKLLSCRFLVYLGRISYSLYLVHWPVLVYSKYLSLGHIWYINLIIIFILASLSYHFVENAFRYRVKDLKNWMFVGGCSVVGCMVLLVVVPVQPGFKASVDYNSFSSLSRGARYEATEELQNYEIANWIDKGEAGVVALVGSSHARVIGAPVQSFCLEKDKDFVSLCSSGVGIVTAPHRMRPHADLINYNRLKILRDIQPELTLIAGKWDAEVSSKQLVLKFKDYLQKISRCSKDVIVMGQVPTISLPDGYRNGPGGLRKYLTALSLNGMKLDLVPDENVDRANQIISEAVREINSSRISFLDPNQLFVKTANLIRYEEDGILLYADDNHLNGDGARFLFQGILEESMLTILEGE